MIRKSVNKLSKEPRYLPERKDTETKRYTIRIPSFFKPIIKKLSSRYGSDKAVMEYAIRNHFSKYPLRNNNTEEIWNKTIRISPELIEEINTRIPNEFISIQNAVMYSLIELIEERRGYQDE